MTMKATDFASKVHAVVAAVAPIASVAIGRRDDTSTWRIDFRPEATDAQRLAANAALAAYDPSAPTVGNVKAECQRRIIALTGTTDLISCIIKQSNANMRANELNDKRINGGSLTEAEAGEAVALRNLAVAIKALRARSNDIEALGEIPLDYAADARWA